MQAAAQRISEVLSRYPKVIQSEYDKESGMIKNLLTDLKAPASNAFTGLVTDGQEGNVYAGTINTSGDWDMGWNFNNKITNPDATIFFPALGCRLSYCGDLVYVGSVGYHWAATPYDSEDGYYMFLDERRVIPHTTNTYAEGNAVRPVAE